jgi:hypothetical protein
MKSNIEVLRELIKIQGAHGSWRYDEYNRGLYNGLEMALATLENRAPERKGRERSILVGDHGEA